MALALEFHLGVWRKVIYNSYSGREVNMSKYMFNKIPNLLHPVWRIELVFICWICKKTRGLSFPFCLPPFLFPFLFACSKWPTNSESQMVLYWEISLQTNHICSLQSFLGGNGSGLGELLNLSWQVVHGSLTWCWSWTCDGWRSMMWAFSSSESLFSCTFFSGSAPPNAKSTVFRTGCPEYHLLHPLFTITFCWNGVFYCTVACPRELASMLLSTNESTGCFICAFENCLLLLWVLLLS